MPSDSPMRTQQEVAELKAGAALDTMIAEKVMGWKRGKIYGADVWCDSKGRLLPTFAPHFSTSIADAWEVVAEVQRKNPGWRFSLLGGDIAFGYIKQGEDDFVCDRSKRYAFGWRARWFGGEDPTAEYPFSWSDAYGETPALAICLASLEASTNG